LWEIFRKEGSTPSLQQRGFIKKSKRKGKYNIQKYKSLKLADYYEEAQFFCRSLNLE
jgi:hypothetical protein